MTIDEAIDMLFAAKIIVGGDANLVLSLTASCLQDVGIDDIVPIKDSDGTRVVEVRVLHPDINEDGDLGCDECGGWEGDHRSHCHRHPECNQRKS